MIFLRAYCVQYYASHWLYVIPSHPQADCAEGGLYSDFIDAKAYSRNVQ